jgi:hypothetical protein
MYQELKYPIVTHDDAVLVRTWKIYHITKKKKKKKIAKKILIWPFSASGLLYPVYSRMISA